MVRLGFLKIINNFRNLFVCFYCLHILEENISSEQRFIVDIICTIIDFTIFSTPTGHLELMGFLEDLT